MERVYVFPVRYVTRRNQTVLLGKTKSKPGVLEIQGGCLDLSTIRKLTDLGIKFYVQKKTNYKTDKLPVQMDYLDDIDIAEFKEIPTYKRMCICILKNDHVCKYMGFALTKKKS